MSVSGFFETEVTSMFITASIPMVVKSGGESWHRGISPAPEAAISSVRKRGGTKRRRSRPSIGKSGTDPASLVRLRAVSLGGYPRQRADTDIPPWKLNLGRQ